jgi:hypothetical protein
VWLPTASGVMVNRVTPGTLDLTVEGTVTRRKPGPFPGGSDALDLPGSTSKLSSAYAAALNAAAWTFEAWVNADTIGGDTSILSNADFVNKGSEIGFLASGALFLYDHASTAYDESTAGDAAAGNWYHVAYTYASNTHKGYLNGVEVLSASGTHVPNATADFIIGETPAGTQNLDGRVGGAAYFSAALTAAQVLQHYNAGRRA